MKKGSSDLRLWFKDKRSLVTGVVIGAFVVSLLWFVSANTQISIFKFKGNTKSIETITPTDTTPSAIEIGT